MTSFLLLGIVSLEEGYKAAQRKKFRAVEYTAWYAVSRVWRLVEKLKDEVRGNLIHEALNYELGTWCF